jgi:hypothetical protein
MLLRIGTGLDQRRQFGLLLPGQPRPRSPGQLPAAISVPMA